MEVERPNECKVLTEILKFRPPCEDTCVVARFPSHRPHGCWVAHTALTAIECMNMAPRLRRALERSGISWGLVEEASVLHDVGKLSEAYVNGRRVQHNVLSATVALSICEDLVVPTSILLHHEALHWRELYRKPLSFFQRIRMTLYIDPRGFRLHERYREAVRPLKAILDSFGMEAAVSTLDRALSKREYGVERGGVRRRNVVNECLRWSSHFRRGLTLYWVLYLADNRAASARDGPDAYWLRSLRSLSELSRDPSRLADAILKSARRPDITLTAISGV